MEQKHVLVIGGTGAAGQILVERVLAEGHTVTVLARTPEKLTLSHPRLRVQAGDALDSTVVDAAVTGQDAVFVLLSPPSLSKPSTVSSDATALIVAAMRHHGVRRLVCVTALGLGESKRNADFLYNRLIVPVVLRHVIVDKARQEATIVGSDLEWTIVRPPRLTDGAARGAYLLLADQPGKVSQLARADLAAAMLGQLDDQRYLRQAVVVGY